MSFVREMVNITVLYRSKIENSRKNLETCDCRGRQSMYPSGCIFLLRSTTDNDSIRLFQNYHLPLFGLCSLIRLQQSRFLGDSPIWSVVVCHRRCFTEINRLLISNFSHTKILFPLCDHQSQVQDQFQQPNQSNQLQIAR